jgi:hypothetical protein
VLAFPQLAQRRRARNPKKGVKLHIASNAWREAIAVGLTQRIYTRTSILMANLSVDVAATIVKPRVTMLRHIGISKSSFRVLLAK